MDVLARLSFSSYPPLNERRWNPQAGGANVNTFPVPMFGQNFRPPKLQHSGFFGPICRRWKLISNKYGFAPTFLKKYHQFKTIVLVGDQGQRISSNEFKSRIFGPQSTILNAGVFSPDVSAWTILWFITLKYTDDFKWIQSYRCIPRLYSSNPSGWADGWNTYPLTSREIVPHFPFDVHPIAKEAWPMVTRQSSNQDDSDAPFSNTSRD